MDHSQDTLLLKQLAAGNDAAFTSIYNQYWEQIFKFIIRIVQDKDEAADVVQETFLAFWELRDKLERVNSIKSYLFVIARNRAFKRFQSSLRQTDYLESVIARYSEADDYVVQQLDSKDLSRLIDAEIEKLPQKMREIFILSRKEHLSYKEIAEKLHISDLTVKKQINNSLNYLRLRIDEEYIPYLSILLLCSLV